jgi:hypothetical protein
VDFKQACLVLDLLTEGMGTSASSGIDRPSMDDGRNVDRARELMAFFKQSTPEIFCKPPEPQAS